MGVHVMDGEGVGVHVIGERRDGCACEGVGVHVMGG